MLQDRPCLFYVWRLPALESTQSHPRPLPPASSSQYTFYKGLGTVWPALGCVLGQVREVRRSRTIGPCCG